MTNLYVIIVTYNGSHWIEQCLDSVFNSTIPSYVIIIDNKSTDNTCYIIKNKYPQCKLIVAKENLGFGRGNNLGIRLAISEGADYIYLLNQDAWVMPDSFEKLISIHKGNREFGILSPIQITGNGEKIDANFMQYSILNKKYSTLFEDYLIGNTKEVYETDFVMAAHWLLYVPDLKSVGLFSTAFPHYGEDNNLIQRYQLYHYKIGICPHIYGYHDREYRIESPKKELYLKYINFITLFNNPLISDNNKRLIGFFQFVLRVLKIKKIDITEKFLTIYKAIKNIKKYNKYRQYYHEKGAFLQNDIILK